MTVRRFLRSNIHISKKNDGSLIPVVSRNDGLMTDDFFRHFRGNGSLSGGVSNRMPAGKCPSGSLPAPDMAHSEKSVRFFCPHTLPVPPDRVFHAGHRTVSAYFFRPRRETGKHEDGPFGTDEKTS